MQTIICLLLAILMTAAACTPQLTIQKIDDVVRSPSSGDIEIYRLGDPLKRPYKEIAVITVEDQPSLNKADDDTMGALIFEAKKLGADGVIIIFSKKLKKTFRDGMGDIAEKRVFFIKAHAFVYK